MPNMHKFIAKPSLNNGTVSWVLCHRDGDANQCGNSPQSYPDVTLTANSGATAFQFTIRDDTTNLGIKFAASDPVWVSRGSKPTQAGLDPQIEPPGGAGTKILTFVDKNSKPDQQDPAPVVLHYRLNFTDKDGKPVAPIDPEITNGGTNIVEPPLPNEWALGSQEMTIAVAFLAGAMVGALLLAFFRRPRIDPRDSGKGL